MDNKSHAPAVSNQSLHDFAAEVDRVERMIMELYEPVRVSVPISDGENKEERSLVFRPATDDTAGGLFIKLIFLQSCTGDVAYMHHLSATVIPVDTKLEAVKYLDALCSQLTPKRATEDKLREAAKILQNLRMHKYNQDGVKHTSVFESENDPDWYNSATFAFQEEVRYIENMITELYAQQYEYVSFERTDKEEKYLVYLPADGDKPGRLQYCVRRLGPFVNTPTIRTKTVRLIDPCVPLATQLSAVKCIDQLIMKFRPKRNTEEELKRAISDLTKLRQRHYKLAASSLYTPLTEKENTHTAHTTHKEPSNDE